MRLSLASPLAAVLIGISAYGATGRGMATAAAEDGTADRVQLAAQGGNPAFMSPKTAAGDATDVTNTVDVLFARQAALGGMAEVEFGRLAAEKASAEAVTAFARRMIEDHGRANDRLKAVAADNDIPLPSKLDDDYRRKYDGLSALSGAAFDRMYMRGQIQDHQRAVQLLEHEIGSGQDVAIKTFAAETLPAVLEHLEMAQHVVAELAATATR